MCFAAAVRTEWCFGHSRVRRDQVRFFCAKTWCYRYSTDHVCDARLIKLAVLTLMWQKILTVRWWRVDYTQSLLFWSRLTSLALVWVRSTPKLSSLAASSQLPHTFFWAWVGIFSSTKISLPRKVWHQGRGSVIKMNHPGMTSETRLPPVWTDSAAISLLEVGMFDCSID